jgi:hypothetical protein
MSSGVGVISPYAAEEHKLGFIFERQEFRQPFDSEIASFPSTILCLQIPEQNRFVCGCNCWPELVNHNRTAKDGIVRSAIRVCLQDRLSL